MPQTVILDDLLEGIDSGQRADFVAAYRAITQLPSARCDLQRFFDDFLKHTLQIYAATAGAIWFRGHEREPLATRSRSGFERLGLEGEWEKPHDKLLHYALTRNRSFLVKPYSAPAPRAGVSNPTDSFIVLGPVDHDDGPLAVVELFLGPTPLRGQRAAERNRYVLWLDHLITFLCHGIELRFLRKSAPLQPALDQLGAAQVQIESLQDEIRITLEQRLAGLSGWNFGSLEQNQVFATRVQELLDRHGLRVQCPECGAPAIVRCQNTGNAKTGVFLYDHYLDAGRTFHGGPTTWPRVALVPKPARRKSS